MGTTTAATLSKSQICEVRTRAEAEDDASLVRHCDRAEKGNARSLRIVAGVLHLWAGRAATPDEDNVSMQKLLDAQAFAIAEDRATACQRGAANVRWIKSHLASLEGDGWRSADGDACAIANQAAQLAARTGEIATLNRAMARLLRVAKAAGVTLSDVATRDLSVDISLKDKS